jgi:hypothetical protein
VLDTGGEAILASPSEGKSLRLISLTKELKSGDLTLEKDEAFNTGLILSDRNLVVTASNLRDQGRLRFWELSKDNPPQSKVQTSLPWPIIVLASDRTTDKQGVVGQFKDGTLLRFNLKGEPVGNVLGTPLSPPPSDPFLPIATLKGEKILAASADRSRRRTSTR